MLRTLASGSCSEVIYVVIAPSGSSHLLLSASEIFETTDSTIPYSLKEIHKKQGDFKNDGLLRVK